MAFVKRENKNKETVSDAKSETVSFSNNNQKFEVNTKTYLEDAIDTLNILDKKGINIYDPTRYGGMYLNGKNNDEIKNIEKIFISKNNIYGNETQNIDFESIFLH